VPALVGCAVLAAACSSATPSSGPASAAAAVGLPSTEPYLLMTGPGAGWAVWPSGDAWVLLHTPDGFGSVDNGTPVGVPTDGGLVAAAEGDRVAVAVGPVERLLTSPVLTRAGAGTWSPAQLPGAVLGSRTAVALGSGGVTALTAGGGGALVTPNASGWRTVATAASLPGGRALSLGGVTWADGARGWLTGHGAAGSTVAFQTADGGRTWTGVQASGVVAVGAWAPCGEGDVWSLPEVEGSGDVRVLRTADGGATWTAGARVPRPAGGPAWGCAGDALWMAGGSAHGDRIYASSDGGGTWTAKGPAPRGLTDLSPTGGGRGFAASGGADPALWRVTGDGATATRLRLPAWVTSLGGGSGEH
jgi:hypothetical protein